MILIDGKKEAASLRQKLKDEVTELKKKFNNVPGLTVMENGTADFDNSKKVLSSFVELPVVPVIRQTFLFSTLAWVMVATFGSLPFLLSDQNF